MRGLVPCVVLLTACTGTVCDRPGAVMVDVAYEGVASDVDTVALDVFIDSRVARSVTVMRELGKTTGTVEIQLGAEFPASKHVAVRATGQRGGEVIATAVAETTTGASCARVGLTLSGADGGTLPGSCLPMTCASYAATCGTRDDACGGTIDCGACAIYSMSSPPILATNAKVTLEGRFAVDTTVLFPGASAASAAVVGPHRLEVAVPAEATTGVLSVISGGSTLPPLPFRRAAYGIGIARVDRAPTQTTYARRSNVPARASIASISYGNAVYVLGGWASFTAPENPTASVVVSRARVNADGTLDAFARVGDTDLATPVYNHSAIVVGRHVYVLGGMTMFGDAPIKDVQHASFGPDGKLSTFTKVGELTAPRRQTDAIVLGKWLYVIGGNLGDQVTDQAERAPIGEDGTIGDFTVDANAHLAMARGGHRLISVGDKVYAIGGDDNVVKTASVEVGSVGVDGSITGFADAGVTLATARTDHMVARLGDAIYVFGGRGSTVLSTIERASIGATGTLGAFGLDPLPMLQPRFGSGVAFVGDALHIFSGSNGPTATLPSQPDIVQLNTTGSVETFAALATSNPSPAVSYACSVVIGSGLYVIGGLTANGRTDVVQRAELAPDGAPGPFQVVGHLLQARNAHVCAVARSKLYVLSGTTGSVASPTKLKTVEVASIDEAGMLSAFTAMPDLNATHVQANAVILGNRLYVIGGSADDPADSVEFAVLSSSDDLYSEWTEVGPHTARSASSVAVLGSNVYLIGGANNTQPFTSTISYAPFDSAGILDDFHNHDTPLLTERRDHASVVIGPYLYLFGGFKTDFNNPTYVGAHRFPIAADGNLLTAQNVASGDLVTRRYGLTTHALGRHALSVGGNRGDTELAIAR